MTEPALFNILLAIWVTLAGITFISLFWIRAPYGRHGRDGWGISVDQRTGWLIMELPALLVFCVFFGIGERHNNGAALVFLGLWILHYGYRSIVYPFRLRGAGKTLPVVVAAMGALFNVGNGYLNSRWLNTLGPELTNAWFLDPRFVGGVALFLGGMALNHHADSVLRHLRGEADSGYKVPHGGAYRFVSCPNYLGEILQWCGWALATWSLAGLCFALWTVANLAPRARSHHHWYRENFDAYPADRRALIPFIW